MYLTRFPDSRQAAAIALGAVVAFGACVELDLEPEDSYGQNVLDNAAATNLILNNAYRELPLYEYYGRDFVYCSDITSDDAEYIPGESTFSARQELEDFSWTPFSSHNVEVYGSAYNSISVCNRVLDVVSEDNPSAVGQALYLRALNYFNLVRMYGGVPLLLTEDVPIEELARVSRASEAEVYAQIVDDLARLTDGALLPERWPESDNGRATRGAAHALRAKVHLTLASPGTDVPGDKQGHYRVALEQARLVRDAGTYSLEPDLDRLWTPDQQYSSSEVIFLNGTNGIDVFVGGIPGRYTTNYNPIDRAGWEFGWGNNVPEIRLFESFDDDDQRKDAGFVTYFITGDTLEREAFTRVGRTASYNATGDVRTFFPGDTVPYTHWSEPRIQRPHLGKFRRYGSASTPGSNVDDNNFIIFRYAEVLLMIAEAANELEGPTDEAYEAINAIRRRAYRGSTDYDLETGQSQSSFRQALQDERWKELHQENKRWWDLVRWGIYQERMAEFGRDVPAFRQRFPIPQAQLDQNPNLTQNPGY